MSATQELLFVVPQVGTYFKFALCVLCARQVYSGASFPLNLVLFYFFLPSKKKSSRVSWLKETLFDCYLANTKGFLFMPYGKPPGSLWLQIKKPPITKNKKGKQKDNKQKDSKHMEDIRVSSEIVLKNQM